MGRAYTNRNGAKSRLSGVPSAEVSLSVAEAKDPDRIVTAVRQLNTRLKRLELDTDAGYAEFEVVCAGSLIAQKISISHPFGQTVRWMVVDWVGSATYPSPLIYRDASSTATYDGVLGLVCKADGTAIIRVVPSGSQVVT